MSASESMRQRRADAGLTLSDLAKALEGQGIKVSVATLSRVESGRREPSPSLAAALGVVLGAGGEGAPGTPDETLAEAVEAPPADDLATALGARIRQLRRGLGLTQMDLAAKMIGLGEAVDASIISRYETAQVLPGLGRMVALARALGVTVDELLGSSGPSLDEQRLLAAYRAGGLAGVLLWCSGRAGG